jgi:transposase
MLIDKNKKLITTYSSKRAARDKAQREEKIEKARRFLQKPEQLEKKAKVHFLKKQGEHSYILDEEKIERSARFDGFMSVATNNTTLSVAQILDAYKQLYKIEQSFRSFKTFLETRPMYHWTEKRILGHLALCYLSFTLLNYLQLRLKQSKTPLSENQIRKALSKMQVSLIKQDQREYYLSSKVPQEAQYILKALRLRGLPHLMPKEAIGNYT